MGLTALHPSPATAQLRVVPDGSTLTTISGGSTDCTSSCQITGTSAADGNLFHSFSEFSIPANVVVTFEDGGSDNIFTRVSDPGQASSFLGNLTVSGDANFFLINPAGIRFGDNASLSLNGGSFVASSAETLTFEDGSQWVAGSAAAPAVLTISTPAGLQFGTTVAPIVSQSQASVLPSGQPITNTLGAPAGLQVSTFRTLALLGGELTLAGSHLTALGGNIELGSVGPRAQIKLEETAQGFAFTYEDAPALQNIQLLGALLDVGGPGGGQIHLQGNDVTLESAGLFGANLGPIDGGEFAIDARTLSLDDSVMEAITLTPSQGTTITFNVDSLTLGNDSVVSTETQGPGNSGAINIQGFGSQALTPLPASRISLDASFLGTEVGIGATGEGGGVSIATSVLALQDAGILTNTFGAGTGGDLAIAATTAATLQGNSQITTIADDFAPDPTAPNGIGISIPNVGEAGNIQLEAGTLALADGSQIQATTFGKTGNGGSVSIRANTVTLTGQSDEGRASGVFSQIEPGTLSGDVPSQARGGDIDLAVESLSLELGGVISTSALSGGTAGNIRINSADRVEIVGSPSSPSGIFAIGEGNGQAGNIEVAAHQLRLSSQAQIAASTLTRDGGEVALQIADHVVIRDGSLISARAGEGGSGGNVSIETGFLVGETALDSDIVASAIDGPGGNILIRASGILGFAEGPASLGNDTNDIDASSQFGRDGTVTIENPEADPSKGLVALPERLADLANQVGQSCGSASTLAANQFRVTGRGGLPPTPGAALRDRQLFADVGPLAPSQQTPVTPAIAQEISTAPPAQTTAPQIVEAQGWSISPRGEIALLNAPTTGNHTAPGHLYANCQGVSS